MQWLTSILLPLVAAQSSVKQFNAEELEKYLKEEKNVFLLDVREPKELQEYGSIKGYTNIPLSQVESRLSEIPKDKVIVTLCERGVRAGRAANVLTRHGYTVTAACGHKEWREKQKPSVFPKK
jgi:rhodanese-related sulfurtransferase